jgi:hypothetical protein
MPAAMTRTRIRIRDVEAPGPAARPLPLKRLAVGFAAVLCLALWMTSTTLLVGSARRDGGRVLACQYFTGTRVVERQYAVPARGHDRHACPLVRRG